MLYSFNTYDICNYYYDYGTYQEKLSKKSLPDFTKEDTGVLIFNKEQNEKALSLFLNDSRFKILFETPYCVNTRYSKTQARNKMIIFELADGLENAAL